MSVRRVAEQPPKQPALQPDLVPAMGETARPHMIHTDPATLEGRARHFPMQFTGGGSMNFTGLIRQLHSSIKTSAALEFGGWLLERSISGPAMFPCPMSNWRRRRQRSCTSRPFLGAVVPICNIPGVTKGCEISSGSAGGYSLGEDHVVDRCRDFGRESGSGFSRSSDPGVHRSDSSSTTFIFTDYLPKVSGEWRKLGRRGNLGEVAGGAAGTTKGLEDWSGKRRARLDRWISGTPTRTDSPLAA